MKFLSFFLLFFFIFINSVFSQNDSIKIYLIPGIGSDYRIFEKINPSGNYDTVYIHYPEISKKCSMTDYAHIIAQQIDTTQRIILVGVSLGGIISTELFDIVNPELAILISSAKKRDELPFRYRFQKYFPLYFVFPKGLIKVSSYVAQPLVEPDRRNNKETFKAMLHDKSAAFMKQSVRLVANWERTAYADNIYHIHGNNDKTIPIRNVKYDYLIENGSHMIALTRGDEINTLIENILTEFYK